MTSFRSSWSPAARRVGFGVLSILLSAPLQAQPGTDDLAISETSPIGTVETVPASGPVVPPVAGGPDARVRAVTPETGPGLPAPPIRSAPAGIPPSGPVPPVDPEPPPVEASREPDPVVDDASTPGGGGEPEPESGPDPGSRLPSAEERARALGGGGGPEPEAPTCDFSTLTRLDQAWEDARTALSRLREVVSRNDAAEDPVAEAALGVAVDRLEAAVDGTIASASPELAESLDRARSLLTRYRSLDASAYGWYNPYGWVQSVRRWLVKRDLIEALDAVASRIQQTRNARPAPPGGCGPLPVPHRVSFPATIARDLEPGQLPRVVARSPSGRTLEVAAYPDGDGYAVRLLATESGTWTLSAPGGETVAVELEGQINQVVRVDPAAGRVFTRADGRVLVPVGMNLGWVLEGNSRDERLEAWKRYLDKISQSGQNWIRIWSCPWSLWLETRSTGAGHYDAESAIRLDTILEMAARRNLYVQMVFEYHGMLRRKNDWDKNPYNRANGGPCRSPGDFFTDSRARELFKRRLDYIVARYAAYANVFAWELWNEVDLTIPNPVSAIRWHEEMAAHLKRIDPYGHMVTTSTAGNTILYAGLWGLDDIAFAQTHIYRHDLADNLPDEIRTLRLHRKPAIAGEAGQDSAWEPYIWETRFDPLAIGLHDALYAGLLGGSAGTGMFWWWDKYIDPGNLYPLFRPASRIARMLEETGASLHPVDVKASGTGSRNLLLQGLGSPERILIWAKDEDYLPSESRPRPPARRLGPFRIRVECDRAGDWRITRFDPWTGAESPAGQARSTGRRLAFSLAPFDRDVILVADRP